MFFNVFQAACGLPSRRTKVVGHSRRDNKQELANGYEMRAEQALLDAHFSQPEKVLGQNLQSASFSKSARTFAERAL